MTRSDLEGITKLYQNYMSPFQGDPFALLVSIGGVETSFGSENVPRFEPGYSNNSIAYKRSPLLQMGWDKYGDHAACSYGPWQILWISAIELGFDINRKPDDLTNAETCVPFVIKFINRLISRDVTKPENLLASWNGGPRGWVKPNDDVQRYVKKAMAIYNQLVNNKS